MTHLVRAGCYDEAVDILYKIACDEHLEGTTRAIIGSTPVVCFSEAPVSEFTKENKHFSPFGISVEKSWLFAAGGRPVIYQPKDEHHYINPAIHWKLVSFDPIKSQEDGWVDWSWQREWRIPSEMFYLPYEQAIFLVPSEEYRDRLLARYRADEEYRALYEALCLDLYPYPPSDFPYQIEVIAGA
ncbi:abortive infection system antitoxin AbiGi family protein [Chromobacterium amazonense]|uniref:abortive infection system antitoxin AbiGi family protein n=1 Tax=Chromobacterium amazonense TaxID=1382803 RepID=UPI0014719BFE|nr:abortive infection system antitoxin AbiGi family protein [Chromobacterium amazonense]